VRAAWNYGVLRATDVSLELGSIRELIIGWQEQGEFFALEEIREGDYHKARAALMQAQNWRLSVDFTVNGRIEDRRSRVFDLTIRSDGSWQIIRSFD